MQIGKKLKRTEKSRKGSLTQPMPADWAGLGVHTELLVPKKPNTKTKVKSWFWCHFVPVPWGLIEIVSASWLGFARNLVLLTKCLLDILLEMTDLFSIKFGAYLINEKLTALFECFFDFYNLSKPAFSIAIKSWIFQKLMHLPRNRHLHSGSTYTLKFVVVVGEHGFIVAIAFLCP